MYVHVLSLARLTGTSDQLAKRSNACMISMDLKPFVRILCSSRVRCGKSRECKSGEGEMGLKALEMVRIVHRRKEEWERI
jgi:hypothetical protein